MPYLGLIVTALWVVCLVDVICAEEHRIRHLPKPLWLVIVLLVPLVGSGLWLLLGRPLGGLPARTGTTSVFPFPEYDRPGRQVAQTTDEDAEFQRRCRERAEEQRRIAREQRRDL